MAYVGVRIYLRPRDGGDFHMGMRGESPSIALGIGGSKFSILTAFMHEVGELALLVKGAAFANMESYEFPDTGQYLFVATHEKWQEVVYWMADLVSSAWPLVWREVVKAKKAAGIK